MGRIEVLRQMIDASVRARTAASLVLHYSASLRSTYEAGDRGQQATEMNSERANKVNEAKSALKEVRELVPKYGALPEGTGLKLPPSIDGHLQIFCSNVEATMSNASLPGASQHDDLLSRMAQLEMGLAGLLEFEQEALANAKPGNHPQVFRRYSNQVPNIRGLEHLIPRSRDDEQTTDIVPDQPKSQELHETSTGKPD